MKSIFAAGALYGKLIHHEAALAGTVVAADRVPLPTPRAPFEIAATYPRGTGAPPYRVVHDTTVHPPFGRYSVYVGGHRLGAQLSMPSADDCRRMEAPAAVVAPIQERLSPRALMVLGFGTRPDEFGRSADMTTRDVRARPSSSQGRRQGFIRVVGGKKIKRCAGCKTEKDLEAFSLGTGPGGYSRHCRECKKADHARRAARKAAA